MNRRMNAVLEDIRRELGEDQDRLVKLFDSLKPKQKIKVAMSAVMGSGKYSDGEPHEWIVGRKSVSKKYGVVSITLIPADNPTWKPTKYNAYKLSKRNDSDGQPVIVASHGDMGLFLKSVNGISPK
jgi:hypothetical protein